MAQQHREVVPVAEAVELAARSHDVRAPDAHEGPGRGAAMRAQPPRELRVLGEMQVLVEAADGEEVRAPAPEGPGRKPAEELRHLEKSRRGADAGRPALRKQARAATHDARIAQVR